MATLIRTHTAPAATASDRTYPNINANIPAPFPSEAERERDEFLQELEAEELQLEDASSLLVRDTNYPNHANTDEGGGAVAGTSSSSAQGVLADLRRLGARNAQLEDLTPSMLDVQKSCLTMLNDLLSTSPRWKPIVPDRRRSLPPSSVAPVVTSEHSSALHTLVLNLRAQDPSAEHASAGSSSSDAADAAALVRELQSRIERLAETSVFSPQDAALIRTLASLIRHFHHLAALQYSISPSSPRVASWSSSQPVSPADPLTTLRRQVNDFQLARGDAASRPVRRDGSPVQQVQTALLWSQVDEELEQVLSLCHARTFEDPFANPMLDSESLPPDYDIAWYDAQGEGEGLPQYEPGSTMAAVAKAGVSPNSEKSADSPSSESRFSVGGTMGEKMRMDLEAVTLAIDRLYLVAPQLHDQRVELKKSKLEQMEKARLSGTSTRSRVREGKQRAGDARDAHELERMVELIGRASGRKFANQAVVLEGGLKMRLEQARQRDVAKREAFVEQLARHSDAGRLHSQDAVLSPPGSAQHREKDPDAMLSLPEFIREAIPEPMELKMQMEDPRALLSLPEFVKEPVPKSMVSPLPRRTRSMKGMRSRSLSAPPLAWLLASRPSSPSSTSPSSPVEPKKSRPSRIRRVGSSIISIPQLRTTLDVNYVAEYHENLQHVLVFLTASGMTAGVNLEAEVVPASQVPQSSDLYGYLHLKCGLSTSSFLRLPARVAPGKKDVKVDGQHFQIKLAASPSTATSVPSPLLDATRLMQDRPTSYICASCSLPLVHCSRMQDYRDLPSEHWAELVDAWMCHSDQKLHEHVTRHSNEGFWPTPEYALVGGSYLLFEQSVVMKQHLWPEEGYPERKHDDDWQRVRCICGAIVGRRQEHQAKDAPSALIYRLAKYAIRPVSPTAEPCRIPLSAFIAEDMNEFVHAHATYRFIIVDEEEERPRLLIWLFKPSMRIAYTTPTEYVIPKSGSIHAAKVLFKILGPSTPTDIQTIANRYPGFPQAEHLYYPMDICRRLASLLKESNTAYPESMRTMTGLDVGWLQRA